jgi:hypothetical protein
LKRACQGEGWPGHGDRGWPGHGDRELLAELHARTLGLSKRRQVDWDMVTENLYS